MKKRTSSVLSAVRTLRRLAKIRRDRRAGAARNGGSKKPKKDPKLFAFCDQFLE